MNQRRQSLAAYRQRRTLRIWRSAAKHALTTALTWVLVGVKVHSEVPEWGDWRDRRRADGQWKRRNLVSTPTWWAPKDLGHWRIDLESVRRHPGRDLVDKQTTVWWVDRPRLDDTSRIFARRQRMREMSAGGAGLTPADRRRRAEKGLARGPILAELHAAPSMRRKWLMLRGRVADVHSDMMWTTSSRIRPDRKMSQAVEEACHDRRCRTWPTSLATTTPPGPPSRRPQECRRWPWAGQSQSSETADMLTASRAWDPCRTDIRRAAQRPPSPATWPGWAD